MTVMTTENRISATAFRQTYVNMGEQIVEPDEVVAMGENRRFYFCM